MKMVANPATLSRTSPLLYRFVGFSSRHTSHLCPKPEIFSNTSRITSLRHYALSNSCLNPPNYRNQSVFRHLGPSNVGLKQLGFDRFRLLADSGGGSGGLGGSGDGNYGGGSEGGGSGAADGGRGGGWSFISWYLSLLAKYPVLTKAITSAILTFAGDLICQLVIDQVSSLDIKRTFLFTFLGLVLVGPTLHFWYLSLSKLVTLPGASGAFLRLLLDQFIFSPTFIGFFLATLVTLEGRPSDVLPKLKQEWFSAVIANWQLWIPFQFLNFRFVPQQFQVLAANVIALVWNVILSFKAHKELLQK